jgi:hypothetical protein
MGNSFGRSTVENIGQGIQVTSDGRPEMKPGGISVDWTTVAAVAGADITLNDGVIVKVGEKYLRYGQVMCLIGTAEVQTATWTGGPTAGSAVLTLPAGNSGPAQSTVPLAFNAAAADVQAGLEALGRIGPNGVAVSRAGSGTAGAPYVYTLTFNARLGDVPQLTATHTFSGGTTPTATMATTTPGAGSGRYGPYDTAATDGRAVVAKGTSFILNETMKEDWLHSDHPPALDGGRVFKDRVIATTDTHTLADGPTFTELDAAFPRLSYTIDG